MAVAAAAVSHVEKNFDFSDSLVSAFAADCIYSAANKLKTTHSSLRLDTPVTVRSWSVSTPSDSLVYALGLTFLSFHATRASFTVVRAALAAECNSHSMFVHTWDQKVCLIE